MKSIKYIVLLMLLSWALACSGPAGELQKYSDNFLKLEEKAQNAKSSSEAMEIYKSFYKDAGQVMTLLSQIEKRSQEGKAKDAELKKAEDAFMQCYDSALRIHKDLEQFNDDPAIREFLDNNEANLKAKREAIK